VRVFQAHGPARFQQSGDDQQNPRHTMFPIASSCPHRVRRTSSGQQKAAPSGESENSIRTSEPMSFSHDILARQPWGRLAAANPAFRTHSIRSGTGRTDTAFLPSVRHNNAAELHDHRSRFATLKCGLHETRGVPEHHSHWQSPFDFEHGILSHAQASKLPHLSVALQTVQDKRDLKRIPGGLALHEYADVYFHARNPMMSRRRNEARTICVLRISTEILQIPGVVITDQNAVSKYVKFSTPDRLHMMDLEYVFARNWKHPDNDRSKSGGTVAPNVPEALVPHCIPPRYFFGRLRPERNAARTETGWAAPSHFDRRGFILSLNHELHRTAAIRVLIGDMFSSKAQTLVNTVNCVGIMGKGVALLFKRQYPAMFEDYAQRCARGEVRLGEPDHYADPSGASIGDFPTKGHWRSATRLDDVEEGLDHFVKHFRAWGVTSVAFPRLRNGGLDWSTVGPLIYLKLKDIGIPVELYAPYGTPAAQLSAAFLDADQQMEFEVKRAPAETPPGAGGIG
jgi:O-acetyl-ADP-ribose deacetylase (regulator of RNase III)